MKRGVRALWGHNPDVLALLADRVMSPIPGTHTLFRDWGEIVSGTRRATVPRGAAGGCAKGGHDPESAVRVASDSGHVPRPGTHTLFRDWGGVAAGVDRDAKRGPQSALG